MTRSASTQIGKPFLADDGHWYVFVRDREQCSGCGRIYAGEYYQNMRHGCDTCYGRRR